MRLALVALAAAIAACSSRDGSDGRRFPLSGTVVGHETSPSRVVVAHEAVAGLMPAMSMAFEVAGAAPATRAGDRIAATLVVTNTRSWLEDVKSRPRAASLHQVWLRSGAPPEACSFPLFS